jgi:HD-GYP domain-containing protein (c-di-GMP phosphodiesterase class II)
MMGLKPRQLIALRQGAYLHDIGKVAVPDYVLLKSGKLDAAEWAVMKTHPEIGFEIASRIPALPRLALDVVRYHHERWDGTGYPKGLGGEEIPLLARIFAAVDVFDALTSERPYKKAWTEAAALAELHDKAGSHFDPKVVMAFDQVLAQKRQASSPDDPDIAPDIVGSLTDELFAEEIAQIAAEDPMASPTPAVAGGFDEVLDFAADVWDSEPPPQRNLN